MAWGSHSEKEMIIGKVIFEISRKNDVHNNYETDHSRCLKYFSILSYIVKCVLIIHSEYANIAARKIPFQQGQVTL